MMQRIYAQSAVLGNRVGLHYRRFWPKLKTPPFASQILSRLKNLKIRVFGRESANSGYHELEASHSPNVTAPKALMALLEKIVAERP
jgi:hypothetical protein